MEREKQLLSVVRAESNVFYYSLSSALKNSQARCGYPADTVSCPWLNGDLEAVKNSNEKEHDGADYRITSLK